jgi:branched-chain amino acid transport system substrate-binding protein
MITSLRGHEFDTVIGPINFDEKDDVTTQSVILYLWRGRQYMPVG